MYRNLPRSFSRYFQELNTYVREGVLEKWESDFLKEQKGSSYEEDKQAFKRIQDYDAKHGTDHARFYEDFHLSWYLNNGEEEWAKENRTARRKDIVNNMSRFSIEAADNEDVVEITHNPSYGLNNVEFTSDPYKPSTYKGSYSEQDYQYDINPYRSSWADSVIESIDRSRGAKISQEIDVGVVKLERKAKRWGVVNDTYSTMYVITIVLPTTEVVREILFNEESALSYAKYLKSVFSKLAFSVDDRF